MTPLQRIILINLAWRLGVQLPLMVAARVLLAPLNPKEH